MAKKKKVEIKSYLLLILLLIIFVLSGLIVVIFNINPIKKDKLKTTSQPIQLNQEQETGVDLGIDKERFCEKEGPEMLAFIEQLGASMDKAAKAMAQRGEIVKNWPDWNQSEINKFVAQGDLIAEAYQEVQQVYPPEKFASLHHKMSEALRLWSEGTRIGDQGFIDQNNDLIQQCLQLTAEGNSWINKFKEELKEINSP